MSSTYFLSCLESRIEDNTTWYSKFEIGPFSQGQSLTVANALRRTLLSQRQEVFLMGVEIEGAIHEYSRLKGLEDSILDVLLNLRQLSLISTKSFDSSTETLIGYFDIQGPGVITGLDLQFPNGIECINPNQIIGTLTRDGSFRGRFLVSVNQKAIQPAVGDPVVISENLESESSSKNFSKAQWLSVNPILNPVRRVNYSVEQFKDVWEQKEVVVLELWTNGSIHPRQALQKAINELAQVFLSISWIDQANLKLFSADKKFIEVKKEVLNNSDFFLGEEKTTKVDKINKEISFDQVSSSSQIFINEDNSTDRLSSLLDLDIANLNLSLKTFLLLKQASIQNIGNLLKFSKSQLLNLDLFTESQLLEIQESLQEFGFTLNP
jgi:DNA-directed RNA polymerase subunit alpha